MHEHATWINFVSTGTSPSGKTSTWDVTTKDGVTIGTIGWYGPWRCYSFFPDDNSVFERKCLRDIADFCERETQARRRNV